MRAFRDFKARMRWGRLPGRPRAPEKARLRAGETSRLVIGSSVAIGAVAVLHVLAVAATESVTTDEVYSRLAEGNVARYEHMPLFSWWLTVIRPWETPLWCARFASALPFLVSLPCLWWWLRPILPRPAERLALLAMLAANSYLVTEVSNVRYQGWLWGTALLAARFARPSPPAGSLWRLSGTLLLLVLPVAVHPGAIPLTASLILYVTWPRWRALRRVTRRRISTTLALMLLVGAMPVLLHVVSSVRHEGLGVVLSRLPKDVGYARAAPRLEALPRGIARMTGLDPLCGALPPVVITILVLCLTALGVLVLRRQVRQTRVAGLALLGVVPLLYLLISPIVNSVNPRYYLYAALVHAVLMVVAMRVWPPRLRPAALGLLVALVVGAHPWWQHVSLRADLAGALAEARRLGVEELWVAPGHWQEPLQTHLDDAGVAMRVRGLHWDGRPFPGPPARERWVLDGRASLPGQRHHRLVPREVDEAEVIATWRYTRAAWYQPPVNELRLLHVAPAAPPAAPPRSVSSR